MCPFALLFACIFAVLDPSTSPDKPKLDPFKVSIKMAAATGLFWHMRSTNKKVKALDKKLKMLEKKYKKAF